MVRAIWPTCENGGWHQVSFCAHVHFLSRSTEVNHKKLRHILSASVVWVQCLLKIFWWSHGKYSLTPWDLTCSCTATWRREKCGSSRRRRVSRSFTQGERSVTGWGMSPRSSTAWLNGYGTRTVWRPHCPVALPTTEKGHSFRKAYKKVVCLNYYLSLGWNHLYSIVSVISRHWSPVPSKRITILFPEIKLFHVHQCILITSVPNTI